jgi:predicted nucleic acid-binding protein
LILVDSSIWIDYLRHANQELDNLLEQLQVCCHPAVIGELACGNMSERKARLRFLQGLLQAPVPGHREVLYFIESHNLMGRGVGYLDMQLLASTAMQSGLLWTRDRRLKEAAESLGLSY